MGAFRSKPIVDKISKDEENDKLRCASSTMQGWRVTQEVSFSKTNDYLPGWFQNFETSWFK